MPSPKMFVKICGITRLSDALSAAAAGADALGFVFEPTSKRFIARELDWMSWVSKTPMPRVLVSATADTIPQTPEELSLFQAVQLYALPDPHQIVDSPAFAVLTGQSRALWIAFRISDISDPEEIVKSMSIWEPYTDRFLLDALDPRSLGGTGRTLDWNKAQKIIERSPRPTLLAGGLTPDNVQAAIRSAQPAGVDVSTGVESEPGLKSEQKVRDFIQKARATG